MQSPLLCIPGGATVIQNQEKETILRHINRLWPYSCKGFPGSNPISIERRHFSTLTSNRYYVAEKSDGLRFLMYCTMIDGRRRTILSNRKLDLFSVDAAVSSCSYNNTVLDGELAVCKTTGQAVYLVFDCIVAAGEHVWKAPFIDRLLKADEMLGPVHRTQDVLAVQIKHFFHLKKAWAPFLDHYQRVGDLFHTDGMVIIPHDMPVRSGRHDFMFKWKQQLHNTVDMQVVDCKGEWRLAVFYRAAHKAVPVAELSPSDLAMSLGDIVECRYDSGKWIPIMIRTDKEFPNDDLTYERTLINIQENIQLQEFADTAKVST